MPFRKYCGGIVIEAALVMPFVLSIIMFFSLLLGTIIQLSRLDGAFDIVLKDVARTIDWSLALEAKSIINKEVEFNGFEYAAGEFLRALDCSEGKKIQRLEEIILEQVKVKLINKHDDLDDHEGWFTRLWLKSAPLLHLTYEENALWLTVDYEFLYSEVVPFANRECKQRVYLEACPNAIDYFMMKSVDGDLCKIYITPYGINKTRKYHTHICWSLCRAKYPMVVELKHDQVLNQSTIVWNKQIYTLCHFCVEEDQNNESSE